MAYGKRKKGGQRLMEMSRAGAKRKAARKAKTLAQAKANIAKGPVTRGGAKSTAGGRNRTALRTPKRASSSVAKKKKVATPKSDAGKYMGPYSKRTTSAKKKTPASRPRSFMRADNPTLTERARRFAEKLFPSHMGMEPHAPSMGDAALKVGGLAALSAGAGGVAKGAAKGARKLHTAHKAKKAANARSASSKKGWETRRANQAKRTNTAAKERAASKRTEQGYADFKNQAREASRKNARRRGG
tara:strand:+ start:240 stop:971 length:732 start_codon:yes stop_codon:yes gene_type:complete